MTQRKITCEKVTNLVFLALNFITPVLVAVGAVGYEHLLNSIYTGGKDVTDKLLSFWKYQYCLTTISYFITLALPIVSGLFLFVALCKIKNSKKQRNDTQLNTKAMTLHAVSFGLFMISNIAVLLRLAV